MALREILAKFGFEFDDKKLTEAKDKIGDLVDTTKGLIGAAVGEKAVEWIRGFAGDMESLAGQLEDTAARLGLSTDELQRWQVAAKFAGAEAGHVAVAIRNLQKNSVEAVRGSKAQAEAFSTLGVSLKDANGALKPSPALLRDVGIAIAALEDESERSAYAMKIFGEAGLAMLPVFGEGAQDLDKLLAKLDELGGGLGGDAIEVLGETGDLLDSLDVSILSLKSRLSITLVPSLNEALAWFTKLTVGLGKVTENTHIFQAAAVVAGAVAVRAAVMMYAGYLPMVAILALLVLLVDDLITFFKGGKSATEEFFKLIFGEQDGEAIADQIREDFDQLMKDLDKLPDFGSKIEEVFSQLGESIVRFFVDDIPEAWRFFWRDLNQEAGHSGTTFTDFVKEMFSNLWDWFKDWTKDVAKDIVDGLIDGLKNNWGALLDTFQDLGKDLLKSIRRTFKSNSPSKETDDIGYDLDLGLVGGVKRGAALIHDATRDTFGGALDGAKGALSATFAPSVTVQASRGGGPVYRQVEQRNSIQQVFHVQGSDGVYQAARDGLGDALDDDRSAMLAALETLG